VSPSHNPDLKANRVAGRCTEGVSLEHRVQLHAQLHNSFVSSIMHLTPDLAYPSQTQLRYTYVLYPIIRVPPIPILLTEGFVQVTLERVKGLRILKKLRA
jgi:hypothetical protein